MGQELEVPKCEAPKPEVPEPNASDPEVPEPYVPEPEVPVPDVPEPEVPRPKVPAEVARKKRQEFKWGIWRISALDRGGHQVGWEGCCGNHTNSWDVGHTYCKTHMLGEKMSSEEALLRNQIWLLKSYEIDPAKHPDDAHQHHVNDFKPRSFELEEGVVEMVEAIAAMHG